MSISTKNFCYLGIILAASSVQSKEHEIDFLTDDLDVFTKKVTNDIDQQRKFMQFYHEIDQKLALAEDDVRDKGWHHFTMISLERLPSEHPKWYKEIEPFINDPMVTLDPEFNELRLSIRFFLTCYGAWCEFIQKEEPTINTVVVQTASNHEQTVWENIKSSAIYVADTVRQGFHYVYGQLVA